jgi:hypothetical protein
MYNIITKTMKIIKILNNENKIHFPRFSINSLFKKQCNIFCHVLKWKTVHFMAKRKRGSLRKLELTGMIIG